METDVFEVPKLKSKWKKSLALSVSGIIAPLLPLGIFTGPILIFSSIVMGILFLKDRAKLLAQAASNVKLYPRLTYFIIVFHLTATPLILIYFLLVFSSSLKLSSEILFLLFIIFLPIINLIIGIIVLKKQKLNGTVFAILYSIAVITFIVLIINALGSGLTRNITIY